MFSWLTKLERVFAGKTPGPWLCTGNTFYIREVSKENPGKENFEYFVMPGNWPTAAFIATVGTCADELLDVVRTAEILVGPGNIGKTVNTNIYWDGDISAIMSGKALSDLVVALAALAKKVEEA